jgi:hypothetical protein
LRKAYHPIGRWALFETKPNKNNTTTGYGFNLQTGQKTLNFQASIYGDDTFQIFDDGIGVATIQDAERHGHLYLFDLATGTLQLLQSSSERLFLQTAAKSNDGKSLAIILVDSPNFRPTLLMVDFDDFSYRSYINLSYQYGDTIKFTDCRP